MESVEGIRPTGRGKPSFLVQELRLEVGDAGSPALSGGRGSAGAPAHLSVSPYHPSEPYPEYPFGRAVGLWKPNHLHAGGRDLRRS